MVENGAVGEPALNRVCLWLRSVTLKNQRQKHGSYRSLNGSSSLQHFDNYEE